MECFNGEDLWYGLRFAHLNKKNIEVQLMENPFSLSNYSDSSDLVLIQGSISGNPTSLSELLQKHQDYIYNIALKMLNNINDAEDVTQEILLKIVSKIKSFDPTRAKFRTWLYRITFNHVLNVKKSPYEQNVTSFDVFFDAIGSAEDDPLTEQEVKENQVLLEEAKVSCMAGMLMCLTRIQRLTYIVGDVYRIHHKIGAEMFEISVENFRQRLSRARKDLHQWMHNKCGLVNEENPCRCKNKMKSFLKAGYLDKDNLKWQSNYKNRIYQISRENLDEALAYTDSIYNSLHRDTPHKKSLTAKVVHEEIFKREKLIELMNLQNA